MSGLHSIWLNPRSADLRDELENISKPLRNCQTTSFQGENLDQILHKLYNKKMSCNFLHKGARNRCNVNV